MRSQGRPLASSIARVNKVLGIGAGRDLQTQRGNPRWIRDGESPGNANEAGTITTVNKVLGIGTGKSYRRSHEWRDGRLLGGGAAAAAADFLLGGGWSIMQLHDFLLRHWSVQF